MNSLRNCFIHPLIAQEFELNLYESKKKVAWNEKVAWSASILQEDSEAKDIHWTEKDVVKKITGLQVTLRPRFLCFIFFFNRINYLSPESNFEKLQFLELTEHQLRGPSMYYVIKIRVF